MNESINQSLTHSIEERMHIAIHVNNNENTTCTTTRQTPLRRPSRRRCEHTAHIQLLPRNPPALPPTSAAGSEETTGSGTLPDSRFSSNVCSKPVAMIVT